MHRIVNGDGEASCLACGIVVEFTSDGDTAGAFAEYGCRPGGWDHPPYLMPYPEADQGFEGGASQPARVETCAAHPYQDCELLVSLADGGPAR